MSGTTKQKILSGARDCLVREGHTRSTVKRIADYAGVNHGLLHHYFGSKEELMVALLEQHRQESFCHLCLLGGVPGRGLGSALEEVREVGVRHPGRGQNPNHQEPNQCQ